MNSGKFLSRDPEERRRAQFWRILEDFQWLYAVRDGWSPMGMSISVVTQSWPGEFLRQLVNPLPEDEELWVRYRGPEAAAVTRVPQKNVRWPGIRDVPWSCRAEAIRAATIPRECRIEFLVFLPKRSEYETHVQIWRPPKPERDFNGLVQEAVRLLLENPGLQPGTMLGVRSSFPV